MGSSPRCYIPPPIRENHCPATGVQNGYEASLTIILAGRALLVKMLIILDCMVYIFFKLCIRKYLNIGNIAQPLVCKMTTEPHRASFCIMKMLKTEEMIKQSIIYTASKVTGEIVRKSFMRNNLQKITGA